MNRKHGLAIVLLGCFGLYAALGAPRLLKAWVSINEQQIACRRAEAWLAEVVSISKRAASAPPAEFIVLQRHCWTDKTKF